MKKTFCGFIAYAVVIVSMAFSAAVELSPAMAHLRPTLGVWPHVWMVTAALFLVLYEVFLCRLRIARPEFAGGDMRRRTVWFPCFPVDALGQPRPGRLLGSYQEGRQLLGPVYLVDGPPHAGFADKLPLGPFCATGHGWQQYPRPVATVIGTTQGIFVH